MFQSVSGIRLYHPDPKFEYRQLVDHTHQRSWTGTIRACQPILWALREQHVLAEDFVTSQTGDATRFGPALTFVAVAGRAEVRLLVRKDTVPGEAGSYGFRYMVDVNMCAVSHDIHQTSVMADLLNDVCICGRRLQTWLDENIGTVSWK